MKIDRRNGLLARDDCPGEFIIEQSFTLFPPEVRPWARENGYRESPSEYSPLCSNSPLSIPNSLPFEASTKEGQFSIPFDESLTITHPHDGESFLLDPLIPDVYETITLKARAPDGVNSLEWQVDGMLIGEGFAPDFTFRWQLLTGRHIIKATAGSTHATIEIVVTKP